MHQLAIKPSLVSFTESKKCRLNELNVIRQPLHTITLHKRSGLKEPIQKRKVFFRSFRFKNVWMREIDLIFGLKIKMVTETASL